MAACCAALLTDARKAAAPGLQVLQGTLRVRTRKREALACTFKASSSSGTSDSGAAAEPNSSTASARSSV
jgi:hypothetical protein